MGKTEIYGELGDSLNIPNSELSIEDFPNAKRINPSKQLLDRNLVLDAFKECILNNDPEGAMEMIAIYLDALNKAKHRRKTNLHKSTMYSSLKHRNPTLRTLTKLMCREVE